MSGRHLPSFWKIPTRPASAPSTTPSSRRELTRRPSGGPEGIGTVTKPEQTSDRFPCGLNRHAREGGASGGKVARRPGRSHLSHETGAGPRLPEGAEGFRPRGGVDVNLARIVEISPAGSAQQQKEHEVRGGQGGDHDRKSLRDVGPPGYG
jgi:hypothetical protein